MKKLLSLLAATGLIATTSATVVACGNKPDRINDPYEDKTVEELKQLIISKEQEIKKLESKIKKELIDKAKSEGIPTQIIKDAEGNDIEVPADNLIEEQLEILNEVMIKMVQNSDTSYKLDKNNLDIYEIKYRIYQLDNTFKTEIKTKENLSEFINNYIENSEKPGKVHKNTREYENKILEKY